MYCRQFVLLQFLVSSTANLFEPTEAAASCQLLNVPPRQLVCYPTTNIVMVQCSARCSQACYTFSINWYWSKFGSTNGIMLSDGNDQCTVTDGVYRSSTLSINLGNESHGGYYWCEVRSSGTSLRSPSILINPSCDYTKPPCSSMEILTAVYNSSASEQPAVVASSCQSLPKSAPSPSSTLSIPSSTTCAYNGCSTSHSMLSTTLLTSAFQVSTIKETPFIIPIASSLSSGIALTTTYSQFPTNVPYYEVASFNTIVLIIIAATLVVISIASVLLTVSVCICWKCKAKSLIAEHQHGHIVMQNTAYSTNGLETRSATQQNADGDFYSSLPSHPRRDTLQVFMGSGSDNYNKLNHLQKAGMVFQRTAPEVLPRSKSSDYSLLQESRYQCTSLLGSQSDQRYNHVNRATSLNALTLFAPMVPDGSGRDHSNQTYGRLTFDSDSGGDHSNSVEPGKGRVWNAADPCTMEETSLIEDPGRAFANGTSQCIGQTQYGTAFNPKYEHVGLYESRKIERVDVGQSEPTGCGPTELSQHRLTRPMCCEINEQVPPLAAAPTGVCSHIALSEKQSTTADDVPLIKSSPTEESKTFEQDLLLTQRANLGASDHVYHELEQQGRYQ